MAQTNSATLKDIAERIGVSRVAVSVVLNGSTSNTRVSAETRQRILDAAAELDYHPNATAQGLKRGRTNTLGVVFGATATNTQTMSSSLTTNILQGVAEAAEEGRYNLMLFINPWRDGNQGVNCLRDQRTDGAVFAMPLTKNNMAESLIALGQPLVFIGYPADALGIPSVDVDNVRAAYDATRHLLELGHRRIAHLQGDDFYICTGQRRDGFLRAMTEAGMVVPPDYLIADTYSGVTTQETFLRLMALPNPPTAIFTGNDIMAGQVVRAAKKANISIPSQLSIVGFDDLYLPTLMDEPVTSIRQPFLEMGRQAGLILLQMLKGEEVPATTRLLDHELIVRHTTAPPAETQRG